jgi:hypothetical protein
MEGYTGIGWGDSWLIYNILVCALIVLLSMFAYAFYTCYPLFEKMFRGLLSLKERPNLFDTPTRESVFFNVFMRFQAFFLSAVILFLVFCRVTGIQEQSVRQALILLTVMLILMVLLYLLKRILYYLFSSVFITKGKYKLWNTTYHTLLYFYGMLLYLPVCWLNIDRERFEGGLILFIVIYVLFRITALFVKIRIFFDKNNGFLYLILYLCGQEIVPLLFLYESLIYLHNVIEASILWQ